MRSRTRFPVRCVTCGVVPSCAQAFVRPLYLGTARNPESAPVVGGRTWGNFVRAVGEREYVAEAVCARTPALVIPVRHWLFCEVAGAEVNVLLLRSQTTVDFAGPEYFL